MKIEESVYEIFGEKLLPNFDSNRLVDWAYSIMLSGTETESIVVLAGLGHDSGEAREKYFLKAIEELGITIQKTDQELLEFVALRIAEQVIDGTIKPSIALRLMFQIFLSTNNNWKYVQFIALDDDFNHLKEHGSPLFNPELTIENIESFIVREFALLIDLINLKFENSITEYFVCNDCSTISKPELVSHFQFKKPHRFYTEHCSKCKSKNIDSFRTQSARIRIIEHLKNT